MEILDPIEMAAADELAAKLGHSTFALMQRAGDAVARVALEHFAACEEVAVLCGPGNNGGDGYIAAARLRDAGIFVSVWKSGTPRAGSDAAAAASAWSFPAREIAAFQPRSGMLVIDALFGAGLARPLAKQDQEALTRIREVGCAVLAVDLPSGVSGRDGQVLGDALTADRTVTFFRKKPGHLLYPGRQLCGAITVIDIGIPDGVLETIGIRLWENDPTIWQQHLPRPDATSHKYQRGHVAVLTGGPSSTGAARLAAEGAARSGAGAVTLLSPASALLVNAAHLTATMLRRYDEPGDVADFIEARKLGAVVCGPGFGTGDAQHAVVNTLLHSRSAAVVFDADAITLLAKGKAKLPFRSSTDHALVLTPHEGEFGRLFPMLVEDASLSKVDRARQAAQRSGATIIYKGADTVVAAPDGRAVINANGTVWLATAGSGDVLSGLVAGLLAQGMPAFEAACAAVFVHAEAGAREGFGLTAEDLPQAARCVLAGLIG